MMGRKVTNVYDSKVFVFLCYENESIILLINGKFTMLIWFSAPYEVNGS